MKLKKLPQDIRNKVKSHKEKINTLNSSELFEYSKCLMVQKDLIGEDVTKYLFDVIDSRTKEINSMDTVKKQVTDDENMINKFLKGKKK